MGTAESAPPKPTKPSAEKAKPKKLEPGAAPGRKGRGLPGQPGLQLFVGIGFVVVSVPGWLATAAGLVLFRDRRWTALWLPVAWVLAERALITWTGIPSEWLFSQVDAPLILAAVGHLGLVPATLLCLFVAASAGQAVALHSRPTAGLSLGVLVAGVTAVWLMGPLPPRTEILARVGIVHLRSLIEIPPVELGVLTPPRYGRRNMVLAVEPDGRIAEGRAKRILMPYFERSFLGLGHDLYVPGTSAPLLEAGGLRIAPLICGEVLSCERFFEARAAGAELLAILASDRYQSRLPQPRWQVLAQLRLHAVEVGLPAVYASLEGQAAIVAAGGARPRRDEGRCGNGQRRRARLTRRSSPRSRWAPRRRVASSTKLPARAAPRCREREP